MRSILDETVRRVRRPCLPKTNILTDFGDLADILRASSDVRWKVSDVTPLIIRCQLIVGLHDRLLRSK